MFFSDPLLYKRGNSHTKHIDSPNYPCGMKWRGGEAGNAPQWKIKHARYNVNIQLHELGYQAPLYYMERCNECNQFSNNYDLKFYLKVYCQ